MVESTILNEAMKAQLIKGDDEIMYEQKVSKQTQWNFGQERYFVQTTHNIYLFRGQKLSRKHKITQVEAIVKSTASLESLLHIPSAKDIRLTLKDRDNLINNLQLRYANLDRNGTLKLYGVPQKSLKEYQSGDNDRYQFDKMPEEKYRLFDEEIKGEAAYNKQKQADSAIQNQLSEISEHKQTEEEDPFAFQNSRFSVTGTTQQTEEQADEEEEEDEAPENIRSSHVKHTEEDVGGFSRNSILLRSNPSADANVKLTDFSILSQIGRGAFGRVYLAELKEKRYAIKAIRKDILIEYDQVQNTKTERDVMFECKHPFLVGMDYLFQTETRLYFVMPFVQGGELYKVFQSKKRFSEDTVKFYAAQIILALGELHSKGIAHRDLKLENILVDEKGYLKVIDYGLAKIYKQDEVSHSFCGTPEYLAPEMLAGTGHDMTVDYWAVGILIYEMMFGVTPFFNRNKHVLQSKIKNSKIVFPDKSRYVIEYSDECVDIVTSLLKKKRDDRLGTTNGAKEIINHPFFKDIDMTKLQAFEVVPPYKPTVSQDGSLNKKYFNIKTNKQDLAETVLTEESIKQIQKNQAQFEQFNTKKKSSK